MKELPKEIVEFINSFFIFSKLDKKGHKKFNYIMLLMSNDQKEDGIKTVLTSALSDVDKEVLITLVYKHAHVLVNNINETSKSIIYPKPKDIKNGYFKPFESTLEAAKTDLDFYSRKYNISYILVFYSEETIRFLHKMAPNLIAGYYGNIEYFLVQLRSILFGSDLQELLEGMGYEDDDDDDEDSDIIDGPSPDNDSYDSSENEKPKSLDDDNDEFNKY